MTEAAIAGPQRLKQCPKEYQDRLTHVGGVNRYGEPLYKLVWGEAYTTRAGGYWDDDSRVGYRDVHLFDNPGWIILEWHAPEEYGSPTSYYVQNYDEATGLQMLGGYPFKGRYEVLYPLIHREVEDGKLVIEAMPLNNWILNTIIPLVKAAKTVSAERKQEAIKAHKAKQEEESLNKFIDARMDARMAFGGNTFVGKHGFSSDVIEKKARLLERGMAASLKQLRAWGKGTSVGRQGR
jgi:hypothetical protein